MSGRRLFVGNLPGDVTEGELFDLFQTFGKVRDVQIKGSSRGPVFAFVEYDAPLDAEDAMSKLNRRRFGGMEIRVEMAGNRPERRDRFERRDDRHSKHPNAGPPTRTHHRVYIKGLPRGASWQDLKDYMRKAGDVGFSNIERSGLGVVEYANAESVERAIAELHDTKFPSKYSNNSIISVFTDNDRNHNSRSYRRSRSDSNQRYRRRSRSRDDRRDGRRHRSDSREPRKERYDRDRSVSYDNRRRRNDSQDRDRERERERNASTSRDRVRNDTSRDNGRSAYDERRPEKMDMDSRRSRSRRDSHSRSPRRDASRSPRRDASRSPRREASRSPRRDEDRSRKEEMASPKMGHHSPRKEGSPLRQHGVDSPQRVVRSRSRSPNRNDATRSHSNQRSPSQGSDRA